MGEMKGTGRYSRFWAAFKRLSLGGNEAAGVKEVLVSQYTNGRTVHLHEMEVWEYARLCEAVERDAGKVAAAKPQPAEKLRKADRGLKALRSRVLVEMRYWGVRGLFHNRVNWEEVDRFCLSSRIAGKRFCLLNEEELESLLKKLIAMNAKRDGIG